MDKDYIKTELINDLAEYIKESKEVVFTSAFDSKECDKTHWFALGKYEVLVGVEEILISILKRDIK